MSNRNEAKQLLRQYLIARIPFIVLQTIEVPRALKLLREVALELSREHWLDQQSFFAHTLSKGVYELCTNRSVEENAKSVLGAGDFFIGRMRQEQREYQTLILTEIPVRQGHRCQLGTAPVPAGFRHGPGQLCGPVGTAAAGCFDHRRERVPLHPVDRRNRKGPVRGRQQ